PQLVEDNNWEFQVTVKDAQTGEAINKAEFRFINNGRSLRTVKTDNRGQYRTTIPVSYYYLIAKAKNYENADTAMYINRRNHELVLYLNPIELPEEEVLAEEIEPRELSEPIEPVDPVEIIEISIPDTAELEPQEVVEPEDPFDAIAEPSAELPEARYKQNNLVFLVDVSQSMNQGGRLDVLKASMFRLTKALRSTDKVTIISYASNAEVLIESCAGNKLDQISEAITDLEAGGMTSGGKGFKMAYVKLKESWIDGGNNQVIVVTDGAFRKADHEGIIKMAKKEQRKGSVTTVLAVKSTNYAKKVLEEITSNGGGSLVALDDFDLDQENLLDEIKKQSLKRP
ncbi:MAG: vWA domain-containing protein, partial [Flavobacteriales bacterium]